jgi:hypothetical protein
MKTRPSYFEPIRQQAAQRWDQLERDPDLAGPWHQLFKQVQSPRHILSELLQNADDAGATAASVRIEDNAFVFEHNGEDFKEDHFKSLCRFGYSNKRALHTIGFRGIGFKSTFSLGDIVELQTPTLSVVFHQKRFTEPKWIDTSEDSNGLTKVRVAISDEHRRREVEKNLQEWLKSPVSLLFFKSIRRLRIENHDLRWESLGPGPVQSSEWMALNGNPEKPYLLARSDERAFPQESLAEIRQERLIDADQFSDFPPCKIEIVLGAEGRLYVVLPTGVETKLPFASNAPFIQDPARLKIKDPEISPTNRWLLDRIGELVASVMLRWLNQPSSSLLERSEAYSIMPDVDRKDTSMEGVCATIIEESFAENISEKNYVLSQSGDLIPAGMSILLPNELFKIWAEDKVAGYFDEKSRSALSKYVKDADRTKLVNWNAVERIGRDSVLAILQKKSLPKPDSWSRLLTLWVYAASGLSGFWYSSVAKKLKIAPVNGKDVLYSADEVVRLGEKRLLQSETDWDFLSNHLLVINQNWLRFITEQRKDAEEAQNIGQEKEINTAYSLLRAAGLDDTSDVSKVVEQVALSFFQNQPLQISDCVRVAQIACKLGATAGDSFRFVTRDTYLRPINHVIVYDPKGELESLLPVEWCSAHTLHEAYTKSWDSCSSEEWARWIEFGRSAFSSFVPVSVLNVSYYDRTRLLADMVRRGFSGTPEYPYRNEHFLMEDWDFAKDLWTHWELLSLEDQNVWGHVMQHVLDQPTSFWSKTKTAKASQIATTGTKRSITNEQLLPEWIIKFRELPCLPDTRGFYRKPSDLLRRTPETESLMDVELFVHGRIDNEATRPLLDLLGVSNVPTGPERLLDCLRALSKSDRPPVSDVEKWYRRLDQMVDSCSTEAFLNIKNALRDEKIVLTEEMIWSAGSNVFLSSDEDDVPCAAVIRRSVADLRLWRKIAIPERPTADLAIQWLKDLPKDSALPTDDLRRVKALLVRHASRVWHECGCWINLANEWASIETLRYSLSMRTLISWGHLHQWVKQATADFQKLPSDLTENPPFSDFPSLSSKIENRFDRQRLILKSAEEKPWLKQFGVELTRIKLDDNDQQIRIRKLGFDLAESGWQETQELEVIPYIDGTPAGTSKNEDVVWSGRVIYVRTQPNARLARLVPEGIGKVFDRSDIQAALSYCFGRSKDDVIEYMQENFQLETRCEPITEVENCLDATTGGDTSTSDSMLITQQVQSMATQLMEPIISGEAIFDATVAVEPNLILEHAATGPELPDVRSQVSEIATPEGAIIEETLTAGQPYLILESAPIEPDLPPVTYHSPRTIHKPDKPSLIDSFAQNLGYRKTGNDRFSLQDGGWLAKSNGELFPWIRYTSGGEILCRYWIKEHCLEKEPLQIEAEIWGMVEKYPKTYALLLVDLQGNPIEIRGEKLSALREAGDLKLFPATYRLVYTHEHE